MDFQTWVPGALVVTLSNMGHRVEVSLGGVRGEQLISLGGTELEVPVVH